jgi:broad specificity phosphatase PhoE
LDPLPRPLHIGNTSISVIRCEQGEWSIDVVNDMAHLGDAVRQGRAVPPDDAERA